jgi:hypothetical protein
MSDLPHSNWSLFHSASNVVRLLKKTRSELIDFGILNIGMKGEKENGTFVGLPNFANFGRARNNRFGRI